MIAHPHSKGDFLMAETFTSRDDSKAWHELHGPNAPEVGDPAPDFELRDSTGENPMHLSDYAGKKPVALVFGSFT